MPMSNLGPDDFDEDAQPCMCSCDRWFDLKEGNACGSCLTVFCNKCVDEPFDNCFTCEDHFC